VKRAAGAPTERRTMATWLFKADPDSYGLADLERDRRTTWDGIANAQALQNLRQMKKGDAVLIYHTGDEKAVVGLAEATADPGTDPKGRDPKRAVIGVKFVRRFAFPVPLAVIKADARFADFALVRQPRLSVVPVPAALYKRLLQMAGVSSPTS
jgi:predicted RNA-binding protein with PUA-like domain